jgi:protein O-mannosyl-transferase
VSEIEPIFDDAAPTANTMTGGRRFAALRDLWDWAVGYLMGDPPSFWIAMVPLLILAAGLFTRNLSSNYIFDEQEALLANPYVNGTKLSFGDARKRDFWGLPPDRSVGSYRPLPNYVWRSVWEAQKGVTGGVNWTVTRMAPAVRVVARPAQRPGWLAWPSLLAMLFGLPAIVGFGVQLRRAKGNRAALGPAIAAALVGIALVSGSMSYVFFSVGAVLVAALVALVIPVLALPIAGIGALCLFALANLPTQAQPPIMQPWLFHWLNVLFHAANGAVLVCIVHGLTKRRGLAWLTGAVFVSSAVLTEAVSGVVGIADVMGGLGACLAILALRLPLWGMPLAVFAAVVFGLFSKESALVCVPLIPFAAVLLAPLSHPRRPLRWLRGLVALVGAAAGLVLYVELRKMWFPAPMPEELSNPLPDTANVLQQGMHWFRGWFHQAPLPRDPLNNPLVSAPDWRFRTAGALRVFWRGLVQVVFPRELSGDYSFPQEPVPTSLYEPENVLGAVAMLALPLASLVMAFRAWWRERTACRYICAVTSRRRSELDPNLIRQKLPVLAVLGAVGLMWVVVAYFPHSNIPVLLPTVRAERFWYFPVIGSSLAIAAGLVWMYEATRNRWHGAIAVGLGVAFLAFQGARARTHAFHYADDLTFWDATRKAVPNSSKAHLNYSVMWGARGRLDIRLHSNRDALRLAPKWPMAHIYLGDTLCRLHRAKEAWPHYKNGFELAPGDPNLIALALQCLWDESELENHRDELTALADKNQGSWLAYLAHDTLNNGEKNEGVDPKYRPRGYNEGPKE